LPSCGAAPVSVERAAKFRELVRGLAVERGCSSGVAFRLPQLAAYLPHGGMPRAARPHPGDSLGSFQPVAGLVEPASASARDRGGYPESHGTGRAHIVPTEQPVGVLGLPSRRMGVSGGGDERPLYTHSSSP
jgi:hypothetical protein